MIASMMIKRLMRSQLAMMSQDHIDTDALLKTWADDCAYDFPSDFGVGETVKGKKAIAEWFHKWEKEVPKRKFEMKDVAFAAWPLMPTNVCMVNWTLTETNKEGKEFRYEGSSVCYMKGFKMVRGSDYISFKGLPPISSLIKPTGKVQA